MQQYISPIISLTAGAIFGLGLAVSDMISPARVQGFFDIFGSWDPTLLFVMIGALSVSLLGHFFLEKHPKPLFAEKWHFPWQKKGVIDKKLIVGSALFGIGWGLAGLCPGPAIGSIAYMMPETITFLIPMLLTMGIYKLITH